jgi:hypothetical protein
MLSNSPPILNLSWPLWKENWRGVLATATVAAGLETGAFALFMYMFVQDPNQLLPILGGSLLVFWFLHLGVSALHAFQISRPTHSDAIAPIAPAKTRLHRRCTRRP